MESPPTKYISVPNPFEDQTNGSAFDKTIELDEEIAPNKELESPSNENISSFSPFEEHTNVSGFDECDNLTEEKDEEIENIAFKELESANT